MILYMAGSYAFDGRAIRQLRKEVTAWWKSRLTAELPQGWSKSYLDPTPLIDFFEPLRIKEGYVLRAYLYRNCLSAKGVVYALPECAEFPDPGLCPPNSPPRPPEALDNFMSAIEGDGSPWSYLAASILARELEEFGSEGDGVAWTMNLVLDDDPWMSTNGTSEWPKRRSFTARNSSWAWRMPRPLNWQPDVFVNETVVRVRFYSYSGLGQQRIISTEDHFRKGEYVFERVEEPLARGPVGMLA